MSAPPKTASLLPPRGKRVMVVEDDPAIALLLQRTLSAHFKVNIVDNGSKVVAEATLHKPDLLLLDVNLPGMDGLSVAQALRGNEQLKKIPIIFLTARDRPTEVIKGIQAGARHYVTKPFKLDDVVSKVSKLLGGR